VSNILTYDLTTLSGFRSATETLKQYGWLLSPAGWLIWKIFTPEVTTEKQAETAKSLIKAGREQGVKSMRIRVSHQAGLDVGADVEGIPIRAKVGNSGEMELEVEYR
jgi:hypothetical protein